MMAVPPWLQYLAMSTGDKMIVPRASYGNVPRQVTTEGTAGPRAGFQQPTPEGYRVANPKSGKYFDKDAGIRGNIGSALEFDPTIPQRGMIY